MPQLLTKEESPPSLARACTAASRCTAELLFVLSCTHCICTPCSPAAIRPTTPNALPPCCFPSHQHIASSPPETSPSVSRAQSRHIASRPPATCSPRSQQPFHPNPSPASGICHLSTPVYQGTCGCGHCRTKRGRLFLMAPGEVSRRAHRKVSNWQIPFRQQPQFRLSGQ